MDFETQQEINELRHQLMALKQRIGDLSVMVGATTNVYYYLKGKLEELQNERKTG